MNEEKELTIEEMKSLVSLATLLPALLDKISSISRDLEELKSSFNDLKRKYNENTILLNGYKDSVDNLISKQPDLKSIKKDLKNINQMLLNFGLELNLGLPSFDSSIPKHSSKPQKIETPKDENDDKAKEIVDKILENSGGNKNRVLTLIDIKKEYKVDDAIAEKVIKIFEKRNMYDSKIHLLTFPKKK